MNNAKFTQVTLDSSMSTGSVILLKLTGISGVKNLSTFVIKNKLIYSSSSNPGGYALGGDYSNVSNLGELNNNEGKYFYDGTTGTLTISITTSDINLLPVDNNGTDKISAAVGWNVTETNVQAGEVAPITVNII